ncbi:hypothetical protein M885DRAFT_341791 [Pelagophyceae sp. CCMP2097]|nr:hypothetical protein M885DRAFT_341791 [Pelagophyceae sp. CCMP2097]
MLVSRIGQNHDSNRGGTLRWASNAKCKTAPATATAVPREMRKNGPHKRGGANETGPCHGPFQRPLSNGPFPTAPFQRPLSTAPFQGPPFNGPINGSFQRPLWRRRKGSLGAPFPEDAPTRASLATRSLASVSSCGPTQGGYSASKLRPVSFSGPCSLEGRRVAFDGPPKRRSLGRMLFGWSRARVVDGVVLPLSKRAVEEVRPSVQQLVSNAKQTRDQHARRTTIGATQSKSRRRWNPFSKPSSKEHFGIGSCHICLDLDTLEGSFELCAFGFGLLAVPVASAFRPRCKPCLPFGQQLPLDRPKSKTKSKRPKAKATIRDPKPEACQNLNQEDI